MSMSGSYAPTPASHAISAKSPAPLEGWPKLRCFAAYADAPSLATQRDVSTCQRGQARPPPWRYHTWQDQCRDAECASQFKTPGSSSGATHQAQSLLGRGGEAETWLCRCGTTLGTRIRFEAEFMECWGVRAQRQTGCAGT